MSCDWVVAVAVAVVGPPCAVCPCDGLRYDTHDLTIDGCFKVQRARHDRGRDRQTPNLQTSLVLPEAYTAAGTWQMCINWAAADDRRGYCVSTANQHVVPVGCFIASLEALPQQTQLWSTPSVEYAAKHGAIT